MKNVAIIGACGHVGLPLAVLVAEAEFNTYGIDLNSEAVDLANKGMATFKEKNLNERLSNIQKSGFLNFIKADTIQADAALIESDVVIIIIGTPIDSENNPRMEPLFELAELLNRVDLSEKVIILRSTVSPGTTAVFAEKLNQSPKALAFCPERVQQGNSLVELEKFPQIVGMHSGNRAAVHNFFWKVLPDVELIEATDLEAEIGKLFTNMARYIEFAVANEFQMIANSFGVDGTDIIQKFKKSYPRMSLAKPGPNVGGPCLFKDGKFLLKNVSGMTMTEMAFRVNEGMPAYIVQQMQPLPGDRALILGAAFKAESDDIRNSLSFKLKKLLINEGVDVTIYDPHVPGYEKLPKLDGFDYFVVMTPHSQIEKLLGQIDDERNANSTIVDFWKCDPDKGIMY